MESHGRLLSASYWTDLCPGLTVDDAAAVCRPFSSDEDPELGELINFTTPNIIAVQARYLMSSETALHVMVTFI